MSHWLASATINNNRVRLAEGGWLDKHVNIQTLTWEVNDVDVVEKLIVALNQLGFDLGFIDALGVEGRLQHLVELH